MKIEIRSHDPYAAHDWLYDSCGDDEWWDISESVLSLDLLEPMVFYLILERSLDKANENRNP